MMNLAEKIKKRRKRQRMTFDELVENAGISKGALSQIESGKNTNPTLKTMQKIAYALDMPTRNLLPDEE